LTEKTPDRRLRADRRLQFEHPCHSRFGYTEQQVDEQLRRAVDATESFAIARELWAGDLTRAAVAAGDTDAANLSLVDDPTVLNAGAPVKVHRALGMSSRPSARPYAGSSAYVHLVPRNPRPVRVPHPRREPAHLVLREPDRRRRRLPGTAPIGTADAPGVAWIYGTGPVVVRRTALFADTDEVASLDTATNTYTRRASKIAAATFDRAAHFAVPVDLNA
jgi:hypothetical protein